MIKESEKLLVDLLRQIKEVFKDHNIDIWLDCGTLLGAVRDRKIIQWEHDLDFGAWSEKVTPNTRISIAKILSDKGLKVFIADSHMNIKNSEETWADINFYILLNENAIFPLYMPTTSIGKFLYMSYEVLTAPYHYDIEYIFKLGILIRNMLVIISRVLPSLWRKILTKVVLSLCKKMHFKDVSWIIPIRYLSKFLTIMFYGMEFYIPNKTEEYLAFRYGNNWRIPRRDWDTIRDDGASRS